MGNEETKVLTHKEAASLFGMDCYGFLGTMDLRGTDFEVFEDGEWKIGGDLIISGSEIRELPEWIMAEEIDAHCSKLKELPEHLCAAFLDIRDTEIETLPRGLYICGGYRAGYINIKGSRVRHIPFIESMATKNNYYVEDFDEVEAIYADPGQVLSAAVGMVVFDGETKYSIIDGDAAVAR